MRKLKISSTVRYSPETFALRTVSEDTVEAEQHAACASITVSKSSQYACTGVQYSPAMSLPYFHSERSARDHGLRMKTKRTDYWTGHMRQRW
jgi:hypothetical protein